MADLSDLSDAAFGAQQAAHFPPPRHTPMDYLPKWYEPREAVDTIPAPQPTPACSPADDDDDSLFGCVGAVVRTAKLWAGAWALVLACAGIGAWLAGWLRG